MNGVFAGKITGTGNLIKTGNGHLRLSNTTHDYSGTTLIQNNGALITTANNVLPSSTVVTLTQQGQLIIEGSSTLSIAGLISSSSNAKVKIKNTDATLVVTNTSAMTFAGVISGSGQLTKTGSNSLTLSGANTYNGGTLINAGSLILGAAGVLSDTGWVQLANTSGATLNLNNNNETIGAITGGGTTGGNIVLGSGNLTINQIYRRGISGYSQNTTYAGVISGSGLVTKTGYGHLTLTGANTYTGGTNINSGALGVNINNGLAANRAISISNTGFLLIYANRTITTSALTITANAKLQIKNGAIVNINQTTNTEMAGTIIGSGIGENKGKLRKTGSGTFNITGSNNITVESY
jgi:fibronectin-binding autotransporter adhesin